MTATLACVVLGASAQVARAGINVWTSRGPGTGAVHVLIVDPATPSTLYAAADGPRPGFGGRLGLAPPPSSTVFKSTDGGNTWSALITNRGFRDTFTALAIDPVTPSTLYAGTAGSSCFHGLCSGRL